MSFLAEESISGNLNPLGLSRVVQRPNFKGLEFVMPAQAGIQGKYSLAFSSSYWIPAFAGMT